MKIVNLTPHALTFMNDLHDVVANILPSGMVARCTVRREEIAQVTIVDTEPHQFIDHDEVKIPIHRTTFGAVEGLPEPQGDTIYIVSTIVAQAVPDRQDVFIVDDAVRDETGRIIGARALATMAKEG